MRLGGEARGLGGLHDVRLEPGALEVDALRLELLALLDLGALGSDARDLLGGLGLAVELGLTDAELVACFGDGDVGLRLRDIRELPGRRLLLTDLGLGIRLGDLREAAGLGLALLDRGLGIRLRDLRRSILTSACRCLVCASFSAAATSAIRFASACFCLASASAAALAISASRIASAVAFSPIAWR